MASVPVTLVGVAYTDKTGNPPIHLTIVAEMYATGLGVGGGPAQPPLQIWGGGGVGNYPDAGLPPQQPGGPIHIWGGGNMPYPDNSLPIPQPPIDVPPGEPDDNGFIKPPPEGGGWAFHSTYGWMWDVQAGQPGPKR